MTKIVIEAGQLFDGTTLTKDQAILVSQGRVEALGQTTDFKDPSFTRYNLQDQLITPGLIDMHVNGGGGVMLNSNPTVNGLQTLVHRHQQLGTAYVVPTLITDQPTITAQAIQAVQTSLSQNMLGVLGLHLEGPFLNPKFCGLHNPKLMRQPTAEDWRLYTQLTRGVKIMTVAPEQLEKTVLHKLNEQGFLLLAGHSAATADELEECQDLVVGCTHLFNAMRGMTSREPGVVGFALNNPDYWVSIIVDQLHVHPKNLELLFKLKPSSQVMLISDAMAAAGTEDRSFSFQGQTIYCNNGQYTNQHGKLAGAHLYMSLAVKNSVHGLGLSLEQALQMATVQPATFLNLHHELGYIRPNYRASFTAFDSELNPVNTMVEGHWVKPPTNLPQPVHLK